LVIQPSSQRSNAPLRGNSIEAGALTHQLSTGRLENYSLTRSHKPPTRYSLVEYSRLYRSL
jgi:hypothetical protein